MIGVAIPVAKSSSPDDLLVQDAELFAGLGCATHNRVVQLLANSIRAAVERHPDIFSRLMPDPEVTLTYHQQLIDAVHRQHGDAAFPGGQNPPPRRR